MERKKASSKSQLKTARLREVELSDGLLVYFLPINFNRAVALKNLKDDESEEAVNATIDLLIDLVRDENGEKMFDSADDIGELPVDVIGELSSKLRSMMTTGSANDNPLAATLPDEPSSD